jgi:DNA repair exonuclease SbcCD ATPase subunit
MKRWILPVVSIAALAAAAFLHVKAPKASQPDRSEMEKWKSLAIELRERLDTLEMRTEPPAVPAPAQERSHSAPPKTGLPASVQRGPDLTPALEEKSRLLASAESSIQDLRSKLEEMDVQIKQLQKQQESQQSAEAELRQRLDKSSEQFRSLEEEMKTRETRLQALTSANSGLQKRAGENEKKLARVKQLGDEITDLSRRREALLTTLYGRYREATDLFRGLALRLEDARDGAAIAGHDVSRIQSAVQLAEEDLRQLRILGTRMNQVQRDFRASLQ